MAERHMQQNESGRQQNEAGQWNRPAREFAERAAEASDQQIDRLERTFGAFWRDAGQDQFGPVAKTMARANLEVVDWMTRRARAYTELPLRLMRCPTPQDAISEQGRFVKEMMEDYQSMASNLLDYFTGMQPGERRVRPH